MKHQARAREVTFRRKVAHRLRLVAILWRLRRILTNGKRGHEESRSPCVLRVPALGGVLQTLADDGGRPSCT